MQTNKAVPHRNKQLRHKRHKVDSTGVHRLTREPTNPGRTVTLRLLALYSFTTAARDTDTDRVSDSQLPLLQVPTYAPSGAAPCERRATDQVEAEASWSSRLNLCNAVTLNFQRWPGPPPRRQRRRLEGSNEMRLTKFGNPHYHLTSPLAYCCFGSQTFQATRINVNGEGLYQLRDQLLAPSGKTGNIHLRPILK